MVENMKAEKTAVRLPTVFDLGIQPLANDFTKDGEEQSGFAPLKVKLCPRCNLAQLSIVVRPDILYRHYRYVTSQSETMKAHFETIRALIETETTGRRLLEIGSNDGFLLEWFGKKGYQVWGVDPAENLCKKAKDRGLNVRTAFWDRRVAEELRPMLPQIVLARHVFCHVDDWKEFVKGLDEVCGRDTLICIEVPYVADLLRKGEFDTIYHEHTSYLSIKAMAALLKDTNLALHRIEPLEIHGGAIFIMIRRKDTDRYPHKSASQFVQREEVGEEAWREFSLRCHAKIGALQSFVDHAITNGKRVVGYGASAKSTVWINACGFGKKQIQYICDNTHEKLYRFSPGTDIPIVEEQTLTFDQPDYAICFAWNFFEEIQKKNPLFPKGGGKWIIPHPEIKVI
jgi:SAM-dependent methyltransferase